jgi:hypothetical protein
MELKKMRGEVGDTTRSESIALWEKFQGRLEAKVGCIRKGHPYIV